MSKNKAPGIVSMSLFGSTFFVALSSGLIMSCSGYYIPWHTNAFSVFAGTITQGIVVVGCGGLTGLSYANFSVMPSVTKKIDQTKSSLSS